MVGFLAGIAALAIYSGIDGDGETEEALSPTATKGDGAGIERVTVAAPDGTGAVPLPPAFHDSDRSSKTALPSSHRVQRSASVATNNLPLRVPNDAKVDPTPGAAPSGAVALPEVHEAQGLAATFSQRVSAKPPVAAPFLVIVDAAAPGNSIAVGNVRVQVEGVAAGADGRDAEIEVAVNAETAAITPGLTTQGATSRSSHALHPQPAGLNYEEQLFRTRWGWAAFAEAQRIGREVERSAP